MDDTGMTLADKLAYIEEVREVFGEEAASDVARRFGLEVAQPGYLGEGARRPEMASADA